MKSKEEILTEQAVEIRELIPEVVNGYDTSSMACCPTERYCSSKLKCEGCT